jgi:hypothetical protein
VSGREKNFLVIGTEMHQDLVEPLEWLQLQARCIRVPDCPTAIRFVQEPSCPPIRAAVLVVARPGLFRNDALQALRQVLPLAPLVALCSSWCEGQPGGDAWSGVFRWYWHHFVARCRRELLAEIPLDLAWPAVATESDRLYARPATAPCRCAQPDARAKWVAIRAAHRTTFEALADALAVMGWKSVWWPPRQPPLWTSCPCLVWDMIQASDQEQQELLAFRMAYPHIPVLVTVGFPRYDDLLKWRTCCDQTTAACVRVLGKPFLIADLCEEVEGLMATTKKGD